MSQKTESTLQQLRNLNTVQLHIHEIPQLTYMYDIVCTVKLIVV